MNEYLGYRLSRGFRMISIYHFDKQSQCLVNTSTRTPDKGVPLNERKKMFKEFLEQYKIKVPSTLI